MKGFPKILIGGGATLAILLFFNLAVCGSVDDAQSFALQAAEPYVVLKVFKCAKIIGAAIWVPAKRKRSASNYSRGTNIGFGLERKSSGPRSRSTFTIRRAKSPSSPIAGRKVTLPPRTWFPKPPAVISLSWRWKNRPKSERIGRWSTGSGKRERPFDSLVEFPPRRGRLKLTSNRAPSISKTRATCNRFTRTISSFEKISSNLPRSQSYHPRRLGEIRRRTGKRE